MDKQGKSNYLFDHCLIQIADTAKEGGYVKISGMVDESMDKEAMKLPPQPYEFRSKPAWQRLIIMLGGIIVNVLLAFLIYAMILFVWGEQRVPISSVP